MLLAVLFLPLLLRPPAIPPQPDWRLYMPDDSSFVVSVPSEPEVSIQLTPTAKGLVPTATMSATDTDRQSFLVSWTSYPTLTDPGKASHASLEAARDALLRSDGGTILAETDDPVSSLPGRTTVYRTGSGRLIQVRFAWTRDRFYQIMAQTPDTPSARAAGARFLRSFKVEPRIRV